MDHNRHMRIWSRQATALVAALSLILHVGLMALRHDRSRRRPSTGRLRSITGIVRAMQTVPVRRDMGRQPAHGKPCCILSYLGGMPAPPCGGWRIPPGVVPSSRSSGYESLASVGAARFN